MRRLRAYIWLLVAAVTAGCAGEPSDSSEPTARIAVATSYLGAAARDLLDEDVPLVELCGPGTCPGHFDITPAHLARLGRCRVLLRFDFQKHFDVKLQAAVDGGLEVVEVPETGGLCEPETYRAACRAVADALVRKGLLSRPAAEVRLGEIDVRLASLTEAVRAGVRDAGLTRVPVVAAHHQARFCRWLGLDVAAEFQASDDPGALNRAVAAARAAGARLVVGNGPAGRVLADRLAGALGAPVVMFENFPDAAEGRRGYDGMVGRNVARLCGADVERGGTPHEASREGTP
jgi:zinc transport system substrate-binding protein